MTNIHFGFSYVGLIFLIMLFVPNFFWTRNKPQDYEKHTKNENKILLGFERVGEVLVTALSLIFSDFNIGTLSAWSLILLAAFLLMLLYELWGVRYFRSKKTMRDFYSSLLHIPVAGATLPVLAFLFLGVYGKNPFMIAATIILGIGHIGIHLGHLREIG